MPILPLSIDGSSLLLTVGDVDSFLLDFFASMTLCACAWCSSTIANVLSHSRWVRLHIECVDLVGCRKNSRQQQLSPVVDAPSLHSSEVSLVVFATHPLRVFLIVWTKFEIVGVRAAPDPVVQTPMIGTKCRQIRSDEQLSICCSLSRTRSSGGECRLRVAGVVLRRYVAVGRRCCKFPVAQKSPARVSGPIWSCKMLT